MIGPITVVSESSIGSNTRRIEAVTGASAFERIVAREGLLAEAAALLRTEPEHVPEAIDRLLERQRAAEKSLEQARSRELQSEAGSLAATAVDGVVVARRDGLDPDHLRDLAQTTRPPAGLRAVVLGGSPDGTKATLAVSAERDRATARWTPGTWSSRSPRCWAAAAAARPRWRWPAARTRAASTGPSTRPDGHWSVADRPMTVGRPVPARPGRRHRSRAPGGSGSR